VSAIGFVLIGWLAGWIMAWGIVLMLERYLG